MPSIYLRGDVWWVKYIDEQGEAAREPTAFRKGKNRRDQQKAEHEAYAAALFKEEQAYKVRNKMAEPDVKPQLFEATCEGYLEKRGNAEKKKSHRSIASRVRGHIIPHFRGRYTHVITGADVDEFLTLRARGAACGECKEKSCEGADRAACPCVRKCHRKQKPETLDKLRNHLSAIFNYAHSARSMKGPNPVKESEPIAIPKRRPVVAKEEALMALLGADDLELRALFAVCLWLGLRKAEALGMRKTDVDISNMVAVVAAPKTDDYRPLGIPPPLVPFLRAQMDRAPGEWLFPDEDGNRRRGDWKVEKRMATVFRKAGVVVGWRLRCVTRGTGEKRKGCGRTEERQTRERIPCTTCGKLMEAFPVLPRYTLKDLRSTFATLAYRESKDGRFVQAQLGHADSRTTDRYIRISGEHVVEQAAKLKLVAGNAGHE